MFSNVFSTIWSNPENRILEKQIHGETIVLAENEGRLCAAKRVGNEFVSLILSGIPTKVNTALDSALTYTQLKDSNLQLVGPQLTVLPRMLGGGPDSFSIALLDDLEQFKRWLQQHPEVVTIEHYHGSISLERAVTLATALPGSQISHLNLGKTDIGCDGVKAIAAALPYCQVSQLQIGDGKVGDEGAKAIAAVLPRSQITSLDLSHCNIGVEGISALSQALPSSPVDKLALDNNSLGDQGVSMIAAVLPFSSLTKLSLKYCNVKDEGVVALAKVLPQSAISGLGIGSVEMGDEGGTALVGVLPICSISRLELSGNYFGKKTLNALAEVLPYTKLSYLGIGNSYLKAGEIQPLADALARSLIVELNLIGIPINIDDAKALATALPLSRIVSLKLSGNGLEAEELKVIAAGLPETKVSKLCIHNNLVGDAGIIALAQALPKSQITNLRLIKIGFGEDGVKALLATIPSSQLSYLFTTGVERPEELQSHVKTIKEGHKEFFNVCRNGTVEDVEKLLDQGIPIHTQNVESNTALHIAVERNHHDLVTALLKRKATLIMHNSFGDNPLNLARKLGHHDLVELLEAGLPDAIPVPDPVPVPKDYYCSITQEIMYDPVLLAGDGVTYEREAIEKWLQTSDLSPLHGSALASKLLIPNQFCKGQIQDLIEKHPHLEKETYIPEASKKACLTALAERNVNSLKDLLKDRRLLSVDFPNGLLIELACQTTPEILKTVIEAYKARPHFSHELCAKAAQGLGVEGVSLLFHLLPKKVPTGLLPALFEAIKLQSGAYLKALLEMGVSPNSRDLRGSYPLHRAVEAGSKELITILMEHDANLKAVDREGCTPLQLAEQLGKLDLVRHIKQKKIEIKLRPLLAPIQEQINAQGRVIQQLRGALFETQTSLGNIVPLLGANPSLSSVADELVALQKRIDQHFS